MHFEGIELFSNNVCIHIHSVKTSMNCSNRQSLAIMMIIMKSLSLIIHTGLWYGQLSKK